ncbi:5-oxoprolinase subunit PxpA [Tautonia plasticadhaerens]|uniref:LamB/YcsF family protein n=1 Tax=Tautonia plasticadhaerens TaxID=2527974 RepID=A0A518HB06_9BACT|nr:5-oxoprolinase subunit PxpA [Tautonia plasticadhaerens]QDV37997.1 LamB/YcsF family protein [Tautonia plasticadhaerens]
MIVPSSHRALAIDLNADLGEGFPDDEALLDRVSSAVICCGAHAGGREVSLRTIEAARGRGVAIGAHPGFPDREGFGRRERAATREEVREVVREQLDRFEAWAAEAGAVVRFVKPHGALYNQAQRDPTIADGVIAALIGRNLPILGLPGGVLEEKARASGLRFVPEGFADRRTRDDGSLVPRSEPGAVIEDPAEVVAQVLALVDRGRVETICLHGDDPRAVALADRIRSALSGAGVVVRSFEE